MFVVDLVEEGGSQLGAKIMQIDIQICLMVVANERHLLHRAVERTSMSLRLAR